MELSNVLRHINNQSIKKIISSSFTGTKRNIFGPLSKISIPDGINDLDLLKKCIAAYLNGYDLNTIPGMKSQFISGLKVLKEYIPTSSEIEYSTNYDGPIKMEGYIKYKGCLYNILTSTIHKTRVIVRLLTEYCLCKKLGRKVSKIGIIIPDLNPKVKVEDLSTWKWETFWDEIVKAMEKETQRKGAYIVSTQKQESFLKILNSHIGRNINLNSLFGCISGNVYPSYQIFPTNNYNIPLDDVWANKLRNMNQRVYIHAPFVCGLSLKYSSRVIRCLRYTISISDKAGIKGVVVHTGRKTGMSLEIAIERMRKTLIESTNKKSESKLLLETPAGQKNETLDRIEDLISFWFSLPEVNRERMAVCVDTCHVFAAGYNPMEYILKLVEKKVPIGLIHYNDSVHPIGRRLDRHAPFGEGWIGFDTLYRVAKWAKEAEPVVDCIREY